MFWCNDLFLVFQRRLLLFLTPAGHRTTSQTFAVMTTHLLGNPKHQDKQLEEAELCLRRLGDLATRSRATSMILCGDMNAAPRGKTAATLTSRLKSSQAAVHDREPRRTFKTDQIDETMDYILPTLSLPNEQFGSDHFYLWADFDFER